MSSMRVDDYIEIEVRRRHLLFTTGAVASQNSLPMVTKYTPPCCRSRYVCDVKQNRRSKYNSEQLQA